MPRPGRFGIPQIKFGFSGRWSIGLSPRLISMIAAMVGVVGYQIVRYSSGASQKDADGCIQNSDADLRIASCAHVFQDRNQTERTRAAAHNNRGNAWTTRAAAGTAKEKCQAELFIGEWHLLHGNSTDAKAALQVVARRG